MDVKIIYVEDYYIENNIHINTIKTCDIYACWKPGWKSNDYIYIINQYQIELINRYYFSLFNNLLNLSPIFIIVSILLSILKSDDIESPKYHSKYNLVLNCLLSI